MITSSDQLRAWRSAKRCTQQQIAEKLDFSLRAYAEYEKPERTVPRWLALAIASIGPMPAVSLHNTTAGDLSDIEHVKDAEHEYRRAMTDAALADWARRWGLSVIHRLHMVDEMENDAEDVKRDHKTEVADMERDYDRLHSAAKQAVTVYPRGPVSDALDRALEILEKTCAS